MIPAQRLVCSAIAEKLRSSLSPVWYDEFSMKPGDSLRESIDAGLHDCKKCVVVLSHNFFTNPGWGKGEFNAIMNRHFNEEGNVLISSKRPVDIQTPTRAG
jgi:TIR domain-containing protein